MPESFSIDLDGERVLLDGVWYGREQLIQQIKGMLDGGNFKLGRPSSALEALEGALADLTTVTIKLPRGALNALSGAANRSGKSVEALAREIIGRAIAAPTSSNVTFTARSSTTPAPVASPIQLTSPAPAPIQLTSPAVAPIQLTAPAKPATSPPGAEPIPLTPKKAPDGAPAAAAPDSDQSWFNRR